MFLFFLTGSLHFLVCFILVCSFMLCSPIALCWRICLQSGYSWWDAQFIKWVLSGTQNYCLILFFDLSNLLLVGHEWMCEWMNEFLSFLCSLYDIIFVFLSLQFWSPFILLLRKVGDFSHKIPIFLLYSSLSNRWCLRYFNLFWLLMAKDVEWAIQLILSSF